jgi:hypothetical protein
MGYRHKNGLLVCTGAVLRVFRKRVGSLIPRAV